MINEFRVWDPETQRMWYAHDFKNDDNQFMMNMDGELYAWLNVAFTLSEPFRKVDCVPMKSTGLKDRNGKKIYDGDIVSCNNHLSGYYRDFKVVFSKGRFIPITDVNEIGNPEWINITVVGNRYENTELLKG